MNLSILPAPVPGTGTPSAARGPLDGNSGRDFGAMLGDLAKDAPDGTTPALVPGAPLPTDAATGSADPSVTGAPVPGNDEESEFGPRQRAFSPAEGEPQASGVSDTTAQPVAGIPKAPGVTSLLRLAARAASPGGSGTVAASTASGVAVFAAVAPGAKVAGSAIPAAGAAQASEHDVRRASRPDLDTPAAVVADAMTPVPTAVAASLVAAGALVPATAQPLPRSDAPIPAGASRPEAGIAPLPASAGAALPSADESSPSSSTVDTAIGPGSVRVESHLGFDRGAGNVVAAASVRDTAGGAEGAAIDPSRSTGLRSEDLRSPATHDPVAVDADIVVGASSSRPPDPRESASSIGNARSATLAPEARRSAAGATDSVAARPATIEAASADEVAPAVSPMTRTAMDEPNAPAAGTMGPTTTVPVAAFALPNPQAAPPVVRQVAEGVAGLAATVVPDVPGSDTKVSPARTMALQLSPAGLGTITVRLHVAGRTLDVHLEASDARTAALIDRDRDALTGALRGRDYQLQTLSVTTHDATMPGGHHAERGTDPRSGDTGSADPGSPGRSRDDPSGGRPGGGGARDAPERAARPSSRPADEASLERGGSSLFV